MTQERLATDAATAAARSGSISSPPAVNGPARRRSGGQIVKDIALFFAAPFVTIAYIALFPVVALVLLRRAWHEHLDAG